MANAIEAFTVVVKNEAIERRYPGGAETFQSNIPNRTFCADESLSRCSFMVEADAVAFFKELGSLGLRVDDGSDAVICDAFHQEMRPDCGWLRMSAYQKSIIACLAGEDIKTVVGPPGWDPENPKPLKYSTTAEAAKRLKYLRSDGNVHAYWDKVDNGQPITSGPNTAGSPPNPTSLGPCGLPDCRVPRHGQSLWSRL